MQKFTLYDLVFVTTILAAVMLYLTRTALIMIGWLKGPLLRQFEKYGDDEPFYYPLPGLLVCAAVFAFLGGGLLAPIWRAWCLPFGPGLWLLLAAYVSYYERDAARRLPSIFMRYPRWQTVLRDYTTRQERRRIAYRWHALSFRTRLLLNSSDADFFRWADLVVMGTIN